MKLKFNLLGVLLMIGIWASADAPKGYYDLANGKSGNNLRLALQDIIDNHKVVAYDNLNMLYIASDSHEDGSMWDMYSTCKWQHNVKKCGNYSAVCDCYNKEHSVPQSWFGRKSPMRSDAFHVLPTDGKVNGQRSANPYGECADGKYAGAKALGKLGACTFPGYSGTVFEPDDEYKGDIARGYFYMATRYAGQCESWGHATFASTNCGLTDYAVALLLKWHREDPVSEKERVRNDAIYGINNNTGYKQGNRNPFIDYPCLAEYIWGTHKGETVDFKKILSAYDEQYINGDDKSGCNCAPTAPTIIYPAPFSTINMGGASLAQSTVQMVKVQGVLLTKSIKISVVGKDASMFGVGATSISAADAIKGTELRVCYSPSTIGTHKASIKFESEEFEAFEVYVTGESQTTLVSPAGNIIEVHCKDIEEEEITVLKVEATNVSSEIQLEIAGTHKNKFELSTYKVSAKEAQVGKELKLTYKPNEIGRHSATLTIKSNDFETKTLELLGYATFEALDATNVTRSSFVANWTSSGAETYTLDVFTKELKESTQKTIIDLTKLTKAELTGTGVVTLNEKVFDDKEGLKLGSGSGEGIIEITGNFTNGGKVSISAKRYKNDEATIEVYGDKSKSQKKNLSENYSVYSFNIEPTESGKVIITQGTVGERLYINQIKVVSGAEKVEKNSSIEGYPKNVGNVRSYLVNNLAAESYYYYTITPSNSEKSEEIIVYTSETTDVETPEYEKADEIAYYNDGGMVWFTNLYPGENLLIYNTVGEMVGRIGNVGQTESIRLENGVYVVVHNNIVSKIIVR